MGTDWLDKWSKDLAKKTAKGNEVLRGASVVRGRLWRIGSRMGFRGAGARYKHRQGVSYKSFNKYQQDGKGMADSDGAPDSGDRRR